MGLPVGWPVKALGTLCDILDKQRKPITKKDRVAGEYPYYGATGILDYVDDFIFDEKLILIGEDGAKWEAGENTAFATEGKYWVNNHAHVIRPYRDVILDEWIIYYLNANDLSPFITGLTVPKLNQGKLREIPLPLPPLPEQKRIVAILDEVFEGITRAVANAEKNLTNARELFESYLNNVFTQKGEGWVEKRLGDVCNLIGGGTPSKKNKDFYKGNIFWATVRDMNEDIITRTEFKITEEALKESSTNIIKAGNVVIATRVGLGKVCLVNQNTAINQDLRGIEPINSDMLAVRYLFWWLKSIAHLIENEGTGATVKGVKLPFVKSLQIPLPSLTEQKRIVAILDLLHSKTKHLETIYQQKLTALAELKQSILQKAFAGELTSNSKAVGI